VVGLSVTEGIGLTIIVSFLEAPAQLLAVGVTVITAVTGDALVFSAVNAAMPFVVPLPVSPIDVVLLLHA
jgi:hypothetical protein